MTITLDALLAQIEIQGECFIWTGCMSGPYGTIWDFNRNRMIYVHRAMYELWFGAIPEGSVVMHSCDNPPCIRLAHLSAGSQSENLADAARKGRVAGQKLSLEQAREICSRYTRTGNVSNVRALASEFGVSRNTVMNAVRGRTFGPA